jgi:tRNA-splicing endonuclease subunit Sen54
MHNALAYPRIHVPKGYTMATYHPETNMAYAYNPKGPLFTKMGRIMPAGKDPLGNDKMRGQRMWLLPEECLFLIERGTLDVRWPLLTDGEDGLPMSLQGAYAVFIGDEAERGSALTLERYTVYAGLRRAGYVVLRAPSWDTPGPPPGAECYPPLPPRTRMAGLFALSSIWRTLFGSRNENSEDQQKEGPVVKPGLYRDYTEIYRRLALINWHNPSSTSKPSIAEGVETNPSFRITFHVWKPNSPYRKTDPGPPDFRIAVVNGRETDVPTLQHLDALMQTVPYDPPPKPDAPPQAKIKHGYKNVILAVVDQGVVSYLRIADAGFGREKLYERKGRPAGGKRGGRGGGRGRGR